MPNPWTTRAPTQTGRSVGSDTKGAGPRKVKEMTMRKAPTALTRAGPLLPSPSLLFDLLQGLSLKGMTHEARAQELVLNGD